MNKTNSFYFPVNGVREFSLIFSEAPVVVVAMVSAIVSPCIVVVKVLSIRVTRCQSIGMRCKNMGAVICEFTLLLDFKTLRLNVQQSETPVSLQESGGRSFVI
jgi:hypothetical protein